MPALPLQIRLEPHHVTAIDAVCTVVDPQSHLTVRLSRQQVILGILDQWMAARQAAPPDGQTPASTPSVQPEASLADIGPPVSDQAAVKLALAERVRAMRAAGMSYPRIVKQFEAEQVPTLSGRGHWSNSSVVKLETFGL